MAERGGLNLLLVLAAATPLVLAGVDFVLAERNQSLRSEIDMRQHVINQSVPLRGVNQALIRQIALNAIRSRDDKLRNLLSQNGITINVAPPPSADGGSKGG